jgi:hypothetical protein
MRRKKSGFRVNEVCLKKLLLPNEPVLVLSIKSADSVIKRNSSTPKMPQLKVILAPAS